MVRATRAAPALVLAAAAAAVCCFAPHIAVAKTAHESPYSYLQTYGSALRLVKVDLRLKVTDQDPDWGYLLFEYSSRESGKRKSRGSFEFVRKSGKVSIRLQLAAMPSYHEQVIMEKLVRKLSEEHGTAPRPKPKPKPKTGKRKGDDPEQDDGKAKRRQGSSDEPRRNKKRRLQR